MPKFQEARVRAPSLWASYLVNDDPSSLTDAERAQAEDLRSQYAGGNFVDCEPDGFCTVDGETYEASTYTVLTEI